MVEIKVNRPVILPVVLYGSEFWTLTLREKHTLRIFLFILVINQLDAQKFLFYNKFISCLYMFRVHVFTIRRSKLHYTASGIIMPIGMMVPEVV